MQPGGYKAAFDIYLDTKLITLQPKDGIAWGSDRNRKQLLIQHEKIDITLAGMLRDYGTRSIDEVNYCQGYLGRKN